MELNYKKRGRRKKRGEEKEKRRGKEERKRSGGREGEKEGMIVIMND